MALFLCSVFGILQGQNIDLLIQNGHVFDPKNKMDTLMDVAILDGKIHQIANHIPQKNATKIVDATGMFVCPGLIDIHTHVFVGSTPGVFADGIYSLSPDDFTFRAGITTVVDAGTSGWQNFPKFKKQVIDQSKTRILAFLNIAGWGMTGDSLQEDVTTMDIPRALAMIEEHPQIIVGMKIGHFEKKTWEPFDRALKVTSRTDRPLFVECHLPQYSLKDQLDRMRPGDIITHSFEHISERRPIVDTTGRVLPLVFEARKKGILFDVGHGGAGFWFDQAIPALEQGFWPYTFGTDLHRFSMNAGMKDMLNVMSKYLNMGMPLKEVLLRGSWNPAQAIRRQDLGNLGIGAEADLVLLRVKEGNFGYVDAAGNRIDGNRKLEAELTVRAGKVVWDLNGLTAKKFKH